jgi:hypothetical protein
MAPRLRGITGPLADQLRLIAIEHPDWSAPQVLKELDSRLKPADVSLRQVQRFLREFSQPDASGPWSWAEGEPEDAALVLPVIRSLIEDEWAPTRWPTVAVASWIVRIHRAFPDDELAADPALVYALAALANRGGEHLETVQTYLAFTPWRDGGDGLFRAVSRGLATTGAVFGLGLADQYGTWQWQQNNERRAKETAK